VASSERKVLPVKDGQFPPAARFEELFDAYCPDIVAYCRWRAESRSDAEDAVSEVFLTAWRRLGDVPQGPEARVWLYATARRVLANQRRSHRRRTELAKRLSAEALAGTGDPGSDREQLLVRATLDRLPERDREVLLLAEWEGLTAEQIASVLGCLAVTARGRLHRSRKRFRAAYEELSGNGRAGPQAGGDVRQSLQLAGDQGGPATRMSGRTR
jgi:RNA polymerase sigma factor (sigma-70 family)